MHAITILGLALCLAVLYKRARKARTQPASRAKQRFKTARLLVGAILVWLVVSIQLKHLNRAISGEPQAAPSLWERVVQTLSDWGL